MDSKQLIIQRSDEHKQLFIPNLSIDPVIFGFDQNELKVLLSKLNYKKMWFLPGGYVKYSENLDDAVTRVLKERAGISGVFMEHFGIFGRKNRSESFFDEFEEDLFYKQRFITLGYYALYNPNKLNPIPDELSEVCEWKYIRELDKIRLAMDHREIIDKALLALQEKIAIKPIGYNLLPEKFTLSEFQKLYEAILGKELNRGNFYRKIKNLGILRKLDEQRRGGAHKAPDLYTFDGEQYNETLKNGLFNW